MRLVVVRPVNTTEYRPQSSATDGEAEDLSEELSKLS